MSIAEDQLKKELVNLHNFIEDKIKTMQRRFNVEVSYSFTISRVQSPVVYDEKGEIVRE